jgi:hypothetical protein
MRKYQSNVTGEAEMQDEVTVLVGKTVIEFLKTKENSCILVGEMWPSSPSVTAPSV